MRSCIIPGCNRRVKTNQFHLCPRCWAIYLQGQEGIPDWLRELRNMTFAEEKRNRRAAKHEVSGGLIQDHIGDLAHGKGLGQIEWTQWAQFAKEQHEDFWRGAEGHPDPTEDVG